MIKLVAFDFDGTLFDTKKIIFNIIREEVENLGYKFNKEYEIGIGDNSFKSYLRSIGVTKNQD